MEKYRDDELRGDTRHHGSENIASGRRVWRGKFQQHANILLNIVEQTYVFSIAVEIFGGDQNHNSVIWFGNTRYNEDRVAET